jgi:predicted AlkP superfamily pyrophosphatase or phosphodiesterase
MRKLNFFINFADQLRGKAPMRRIFTFIIAAIAGTSINAGAQNWNPRRSSESAAEQSAQTAQQAQSTRTQAQTPAHIPPKDDHVTPTPRLVVNVVVSGLSYDMLEKFRPQLSPDGLARFFTDGTMCRAANFNYMQTLSPTGLATITTGVNPSMHGIVAPWWVDYVTGSRISIAHDENAQGTGSDAGTHRYSSRHIVMPTLGDKLLAESPGSRVISIAIEPTSAIVAGGGSGTAFWMDPQRAVWVSSSSYMASLPTWVVDCNDVRPANSLVETGWTPARPARQYLNSQNTIFGGEGGGSRVTTFKQGGYIDYPTMLRTPAGNWLTADFARRAVEGERLGTDDATDLLYVCFDASRAVGQKYGRGSMEVEDMIYRLDMDLATLFRTITTQVGRGAVLFVLTSDGGMSDGRNTGERFNVAQFKTILNSFLGVQFGAGEWVLDYIDRQVYLNRNLIYTKGLNLEDVQNRAASFVLQFRGVSHVLTSTALAGGYFGSGYGEKMQNSFYPRRAGDLMLNLMPGWIEERIGTRSLSGSMYDYDTHVPLLMMGWKITPGKVIEQRVDMTAVAPTLARFMNIGPPTASEGKTIDN